MPWTTHRTRVRRSVLSQHTGLATDVALCASSMVTRTVGSMAFVVAHTLPSLYCKGGVQSNRDLIQEEAIQKRLNQPPLVGTPFRRSRLVICRRGWTDRKCYKGSETPENEPSGLVLLQVRRGGRECRTCRQWLDHRADARRRR